MHFLNGYCRRRRGGGVSCTPPAAPAPRWPRRQSTIKERRLPLSAPVTAPSPRDLPSRLLLPPWGAAGRGCAGGCFDDGEGSLCLAVPEHRSAEILDEIEGGTPPRLRAVCGDAGRGLRHRSSCGSRFGLCFRVARRGGFYGALSPLERNSGPPDTGGSHVEARARRPRLCGVLFAAAASVSMAAGVCGEPVAARSASKASWRATALEGGFGSRVAGGDAGVDRTLPAAGRDPSVPWAGFGAGGAEAGDSVGQERDGVARLGVFLVTPLGITPTTGQRCAKQPRLRLLAGRVAACRARVLLRNFPLPSHHLFVSLIA